MRITRVYTPDSLAPDSTVVLSAMPSAHLIKVLRLRPGAKAVLFNGDGKDYLCEILLAKAEAAQLRILSAQPAAAESGLKITLLQAICRGDKMDWVLEKATELGVTHIIPVQSERSEVQLDSERAAKRREHWQRVVISACEQSGRAYVPQVEALQPLGHRLSSAMHADAKLVLEPGGQPLSRARALSSVALAVGPEGGWSERDLAQLALAGFGPVAIGARVLRTETAGIAAISVMQALFGDFVQ
jgi:16S rRNA (uracil1498-N3)-methyltransferase